MTWPTWIEELKERYLADQASAFLLYGDVEGDRWTVDGQALDCVGVLVKFLERTRSVVGVLRPGDRGLTFGNMADEARFDRLVKAQELMLGDATVLSNAIPAQALGRIWRALGTTGTDQGYIISDIDQVLPSQRKRVDQIPGGAPTIFAWPTDARLRQSNNIVLFLVSDRRAVREELVEAACCIHVDVEPAVPIEQAVAEAHLREDVPAVPKAEAPRPRAVVEEGAPDPIETLRPEVEAALVHALVVHPEDHRPSRIPVMAAVAAVLAAYIPHKLGPLTFSLDDEGAVVVDGTGEEWFHATWQGDIALDASAGMLLKTLRGGFSEQAPPALDETAVTALTKRIWKILTREA